jgi:hypothetical protein
MPWSGPFGDVITKLAYQTGYQDKVIQLMELSPTLINMVEELNKWAVVNLVTQKVRQIAKDEYVTLEQTPTVIDKLIAETTAELGEKPKYTPVPFSDVYRNKFETTGPDGFVYNAFGEEQGSHGWTTIRRKRKTPLRRLVKSSLSPEGYAYFHAAKASFSTIKDWNRNTIIETNRSEFFVRDEIVVPSFDKEPYIFECVRRGIEEDEQLLDKLLFPWASKVFHESIHCMHWGEDAIRRATAHDYRIRLGQTRSWEDFIKEEIRTREKERDFYLEVLPERPHLPDPYYTVLVEDKTIKTIPNLYATAERPFVERSFRSGLRRMTYAEHFLVEAVTSELEENIRSQEILELERELEKELSRYPEIYNHEERRLAGPEELLENVTPWKDYSRYFSDVYSYFVFFNRSGVSPHLIERQLALSLVKLIIDARWRKFEEEWEGSRARSAERYHQERDRLARENLKLFTTEARRYKVKYSRIPSKYLTSPQLLNHE